MLVLSKGQILLYVGVALIVIAAVAVIICIVIFIMTGKKINKELKYDYGSLEY